MAPCRGAADAMPGLCRIGAAMFLRHIGEYVITIPAGSGILVVGLIPHLLDSK